MSLRTTPVAVSAFDVTPEEVLVPSAGYGPLVSLEGTVQLDDVLVEVGVGVGVAVAVAVDVDVEVTVVVVPEDEPSLPPHPSRSALPLAEPNRANARRRPTRNCSMR